MGGGNPKLSKIADKCDNFPLLTGDGASKGHAGRPQAFVKGEEGRPRDFLPTNPFDGMHIENQGNRQITC